MKAITEFQGVYIHRDPVDMRKAINGTSSNHPTLTKAAPGSPHRRTVGQKNSSQALLHATRSRTVVAEQDWHRQKCTLVHGFVSLRVHSASNLLGDSRDRSIYTPDRWICGMPRNFDQRRRLSNVRKYSTCERRSPPPQHRSRPAVSAFPMEGEFSAHGNRRDQDDSRNPMVAPIC